MKILNRRPKMILFDYGGTLLCEPEWDMLRGERAVFDHVICNPHQCTPEELSSWEKEYFQSLQPVRDLGAEPTEIQMLRLKYELHGIQLDISFEEAEILFWDHTAPMTKQCLYPNIQELLAFLHDCNIRTGVISNIGWTGAALRRRIDTLLPDHHFEFILASSDYGLRKPDRRLFQVALERASLQPKDIWFCGDTYDKDIEGASEAGMAALLYRGQTEGGPQRQTFFEPENREIPVITAWNELIRILKSM